MERLIAIKDQLISCVQAQMSDLKKTNTEELGEAIDMIKDLAKAIYYCEVYEQMEKAEKEQEVRNNNYFYTEKYFPMSDYYRDMDKMYGRMYYPEGGSNNSQSSGNMDSSSSSFGSSNGGRNYYTEREYPLYLHDEREGRSPMKRKMFMESKDMHQDNAKSMKELEGYLQDLTTDLMEMLDKANPEEKAVLQKKVNTLAAKVQNV